MKKLYYFVSPIVDELGEGNFDVIGKCVCVVEVIDGNIVPFEVLEIEYSDNSVDAINGYLDDNGYGDETVEVVKLHM